MNFSNPTVVVLVVYILAMLGIGLYAYFSTKNLDDYILGGRSLGSFVTALSAGASDMSGWLLMGLPGAIYLTGLSESWIAIGLIIGAWLNWYLVAGRLRVHTEVQNNALTLPDYFTGRFDDQKKILRVTSALIILVFFAIYCASGMVAGARLFESMFGMSYSTALWISAIATVSYVFIGGGFWLLAEAWPVLYAAQRAGQLARTGPYARLRHPQYIGFVLIMLGFLLQWPTLLILLMFPVLMVMYGRLSLAEERESAMRFGKDWQDYASQVPRFFPRLG